MKSLLGFIWSLLMAAIVSGLFYLMGAYHYHTFDLHRWSNPGKGALVLVTLFITLGFISAWLTDQHYTKQHENE